MRFSGTRRQAGVFSGLARGGVFKLLISSALASLFLVGAAQAVQFGVRVVDTAGEPIAGAAVCIGLPGNYRQFGTRFTDADGSAMVDVPNVPLVVTVSRSRFTGIRIEEPARGFNLIKQVTLTEGVPGPRCRAGSALADAESPSVPPIVIDHIAIEEGVYTTTLTPTVVGKPSHYRISLTPEFENARWNRFSSTIPLEGDMNDSEQVYLQLRHFAGTSKGWLEARSDVVTVRLTRTN